MYRWDAGEALRLIEREKVTAMSGVPVMSRELITHPDFAKHRHLQPAERSAAAARRCSPIWWPRSTPQVTTARPNTGYGMTETCGIITAVGGDFFVDKPASCGPAMPTFEVKCVDDDGETVPPGETRRAVGARARR